jgi:type IV secretion system protein VirB6
LKRILVLALILGVGLRLWLYNSLIVDTFYNAPAQLAAAMVGSADPVDTIDAIWDRGGTVAGFLWDKGGLWHDIDFPIAAVLVLCLIGMLCVYAMFLFSLSSIALAVLLALGPLFIALLFFDATKRFFAAWIAQLANYALITVLTVMVAALLLQIVESYATQTAARGSTILTVDVLNMLLIAVLVFLVMRQVMPIASALAGGVSLNSFGLVSRSIGWAMPRRDKDSASKAAAAEAKLFSARGVAGAFRVTGATLRDAAVNSSRNVYRSAGAGIDALGKSWRNMRR